MSLPLFTVGHSTRAIPEFAHLLGAAEVQMVVDVRSIPRSRTNPQYNEDALPANLEPFGIGYRRVAQLGGRRGRSRDVPDDVNGFWQNQSFHNYADYALSDPFRAGLETLIAIGRDRRTAFMCSEAVWWRCHRRIVADYLLVAGESVFHLMGDDRIEPARLTESAVEADGGVVYPARLAD